MGSNKNTVLERNPIPNHVPILYCNPISHERSGFDETVISDIAVLTDSDLRHDVRIGPDPASFADEVGLHKSSLFHHYRNKTELATDVFEAAMVRVVDTMRPLSADPVPDLEQFLVCIDELTDYFADNPDNFSLIEGTDMSLKYFTRLVYEECGGKRLHLKLLSDSSIHVGGESIGQSKYVDEVPGILLAVKP